MEGGCWAIQPSSAAQMKKKDKLTLFGLEPIGLRQPGVRAELELQSSFLPMFWQRELPAGLAVRRLLLW